MGVTVDKALQKELKIAKRKPRNFVFSPGKKPENHYLQLSRKVIPPPARAKAKLESGGEKVLWGACFLEDKILVFETKKKVNEGLNKALRFATKKIAALPSLQVVLRQNANLVEQEFEEDEADTATVDPGADARAEGETPAERARKDIAVRMKTIEKGLAWLKSAKPPGAKKIVETLKQGQATLKGAEFPGDFERAVQFHDAVIVLLRKAMNAAKGGTATKEAPPKPKQPPFLERAKAAQTLIAELEKRADVFRHVDPSVLANLKALLKLALSSAKAGDQTKADAALEQLVERGEKERDAAAAASAAARKKHLADPVHKRGAATQKLTIAYKGKNAALLEVRGELASVVADMLAARKAQDWNTADACVAKIATVCDAWDDNTARIDEERLEFEAAYKPVRKRVNDGRKIKKLTDVPKDFAAPSTALGKALVTFMAARRSEEFAKAKDMIDEVGRLADALIAKKATLDKAKAAFDKANKPIEPRFVKALGTAKTMQALKLDKGPLKQQIAALSAARAAVNRKLEAFDYDAAKGLLPGVVSAVEPLEAAQKAHDDAMADVVGRWVAIKDDYEDARQIPNVSKDIVTARKALIAAYDAFAAKYKSCHYLAAQPLLTTLEQALPAVRDAKQELDRKHAAFEAEWNKIKTDCAAVVNVKGWNKKTRALAKEVDDARAAVLAAYQKYDYDGALAALPRLDQAIAAAWATMLKEKTAYDKAWDKTKSLRKKYNAVPEVSPALKTVSAKAAAVLKQMIACEKAQDWVGAKAKVTEYVAAIKAFMAAVKKHDKVAGPKAKAAQKTVAKLVKSGELAQKTNEEKTALLADLRGATTMSKDQRKAQRDIYKSLDLDPEFQTKDKEKRAEIATSLTSTPAKKQKLKNAKDNWGTMSKEDKLDIVRNAIKAQSKALGFGADVPEVVEVDEPSEVIDGETYTTSGYFDPDTGKIHINVNAASDFNDSLSEALDLAFHENAHNYQQKLVDRLDKKGEADFGADEQHLLRQAKLFKLNDGTHAYVECEEDEETYEKQPMEEHSHLVGPKTASKVMKSLV